MRILRSSVSILLVVLLFFSNIHPGISVIIAKSLEYTVNSLPEYTSVPYVKINNNIPDFNEEEYTLEAFENYSELDEFGRCGPAFALVCTETMPTDERGSISSVTPTGWEQNKYDTTLIPGGYIYNRCHLIGWQLTGENANVQNLITGTRYLNIDGMLNFENIVASYVKENEGHVLYRVTPIFEDENLLASGVLMEAYSVDDFGNSVSFFVYCFNVQPGINIDYTTGKNTIEIINVSDDSKIYIYVVNVKTKKYHTPNCRYIKSLSDDNREIVKGAKCCPEDSGYVACAVCNPNTQALLFGDLDKDSSVTVFDARTALRLAIGLDNFEDCDLFLCDWDSDSFVNVDDARNILRISINLT